MSDSKKIAAELKITLNNEGAFEAKNAKPVYEANLPEGLTVDQVKAVSDYNKTFHKGLQEAAVDPIVAHLKSNPALALASLESSVLGTKFGVTVTKDEQGLSVGGFAQTAIGSNLMAGSARANKLWKN